ncbi:MAG TPA: ABC transporter permease [Pyrinomonadaceae bacterium]|nr:ABC transporter permease [Pyrinomonadaceae bacterium]
MNPFLRFLSELQDITLMIWSTLIGLTKSPRYFKEMFHQMDLIGVGSIPIILLTGFFTGGVLTLQSYPTLAYYGGQSETGMLVTSSLIRELGPVLTALMVAGRIGSAISAELGSMVVSQQIDAMRALGTDPIRKLVTPRIVALVLMMPLLTVTADIFGIMGGAIAGNQIYGHDYNVFLNSMRNGIQIEHIIGGMMKPFAFGFIIGIISCHKGLGTSGGTVGVGRSTTNAVVLSSIVVIIADFFLSRVIQTLLVTRY